LVVGKEGSVGNDGTSSLDLHTVLPSGAELEGVLYLTTTTISDNEDRLRTLTENLLAQKQINAMGAHGFARLKALTLKSHLLLSRIASTECLSGRFL
jgi:hypothetical protein